MSAANQHEAAGGRLAFATVLSDDFLPGALALIESFTSENPWFGGDVVVIHNGLSGESSKALKALRPGIILHKVSAELARQMEAVSTAAGWLTNKQLQFASIEAFALDGYDRVIFSDSDVLFLGSIQELIGIDAPLIGTGDGAYLRGNLRRIADFAEVEPGNADPLSDHIGNTLNTGLMIIRSDAATRENYEALIAAMTPFRWRDDTTGHTDQMLINIHFAGQTHLVDASYNYLLSHCDLIERATGITSTEAKVLHFTGPAKPWLATDLLAAHGMDKQYFEALSKWRTVYARLQTTARNSEAALR